MIRMRDQRGVAMITVLFVAATLTVVASTATFITIREFSSSLDDRQGASSLAYAEAGVDRLLLRLRGAGRTDWGDIRTAGCNGSALAADPFAASTVKTNGSSIGVGDAGYYEAVLTVWPLEHARCADAVANPSPREAKEFAILSTGCLRPNLIAGVNTCNRDAATGRRPEATTVIRQLANVRSLGLPIGLYGDSFRANGQPNKATNITLVSRTSVSARDNLSFEGSDPYYFKSDFYPCLDGLAPPACFAAPTNPSAPASTDFIPAAAHAVGHLECSNCSGPGTKTEHSETVRVNCSANGSLGPAAQSVWDGSVAGKAPLVDADFLNPTCTAFTPAIGSNSPPRSNFTDADANRVAPPISSIFTEDDFLFFKEEAKTNGLFCTHDASGGNRQCQRLGVAMSNPTTQIRNDNAYQINNTMPSSFIAYFEYPGGDAFKNIVEWQANVAGCTDPNNTTPEGAGRSVIIIVRNGSVDMNANGMHVTGAVIAPDGAFDASGNGGTFHGSVIAKQIRASGGWTILNSPCWVANMPGPFLNVTATTWNQVDRPAD